MAIRPAGEGKQPGTWQTGAVLLSLWLIGASGAMAQENWTRFRGRDGTGISDQKGIPTSWSPGDYRWSIELPGVGHSSPIVFGGKLFITSAVREGALRYLFCLDAETGEEIWSRLIGLNRSHKHPKNSWASSTPATDGERVYAAFADDERYTMAAYDFDGELIWRRSLGTFESQHGQGVSPIVFEDMVIIPNLQMGPSSIVALDKRTGRTIWSTLLTFYRTSYATPFVLKREGEKPQLICASGAIGLGSLDPYTGHLNWMTGEFPEPRRTVASPVLAEGLIFQTCGGGGQGNVMIAVDPSEPEKRDKQRVRYTRAKTLPYVPTPIAFQGHLYLWEDDGIVHCLDPLTGENVWRERVGGNYSGSPICIDGKLYCMSEAGNMVVIAASPDYKMYGKTPLGDNTHSTPVVADGKLFVRTFHRLSCLEAKP